MQHIAYLYEKHPGLIIVTPTTPNAGWPIHPGDLKYVRTPLPCSQAMRLEQRILIAVQGCSNGNMQIRNMEYAWLANFAGCPALSAPVAYLDPAGGGEGKVPVSLMAMAEWGGEHELIAFGYGVEEYLSEGLEGGRVKGGNWVDVLGLAEEER